MLREQRLFLKEYLRHFHHTGAIAPSSRWLADALARYVAAESPARRVLEVGPGTGAVTRRIVEKLGPGDRFDLVELNDRFVEHLRRRFETETPFQRVDDRTTIVHAPIEELPRSGQYDCIVSGLPLNNFSVEAVESILEAFGGLLAPGGTLSFFEYIAVRKARGAVSGAAEKTRLRGIGRLLEDFLKHEIRRDCVWPNLPPAWVHHVRLSEGATDQRDDVNLARSAKNSG